jgi:uncharacterized protein
MTKHLPSPEEVARIPREGGRGYNRLIHEMSPYLLQHAANPVNWYPWGSEAFERARTEEKPLFVSIGYSTCHWCHVMERESFEHEDVARLLNEHFVAVKVDREERPDIDDTFMQTTQLMTGRGGWPNSIWLTPDGRPWYSATYLPREDRMGQPGFKTILKTLSEIWRTKRHDVEAQATELAGATGQMARPRAGSPSRPLGRKLVDDAVEELRRSFDEKNGGFDGAPKFPPHSEARLLTYEHAQRAGENTIAMVTNTLGAMIDGGIHDHIGGGLHRYATDTRWFLPHFEKMLYDNACVARTFADAYLATGDGSFREAAEETLDWVLREMTSEEGAFWTGMDAETGGEEGAFYVWTREEIINALGEAEGVFFAKVYGVRQEGNFRDEATGERKATNVLYLPERLQQTARKEKVSVAYLKDRLARDRAVLLKARSARPRPDTDDKVLCGWNGLMIGSLAYCGEELGRPKYVDAARRAADFVLDRMRSGDGYLRSWRGGTAHIGGFLDDYAYLADGLLDLHEATREERYLDQAHRIADEMIERFADEEEGGFFSTAEDAEVVLVRPKEAYDKALPSANGVAARVLVRLAKSTGEDRYLDLAKRTLDAFRALMETASRAMPSLILAADMYLDMTGEEAAATAPSAGQTAP